MTTVQEYLDKNESKNRNRIFLDGKKINETLTGSSLIIEGYYNLEYLYISNLKSLAKITIKDCEKLGVIEYYLESQVEINLINTNPKNIKTDKVNVPPTIVFQEKSKGGFCWGCFGFAAALIGISVLGVVCFYLAKKIGELRTIIRKLQNKLKIK